MKSLKVNLILGYEFETLFLNRIKFEESIFDKKEIQEKSINERLKNELKEQTKLIKIVNLFNYIK